MVLAVLLGAAPAAHAYANTPPIDPTYNNRLMDDDIALNANSMSVSAIQNFLNGKVPSCSTNHAGGLPQYPPPYVCLRDYVDPTTHKGAAQLIYDEATAVGLNPQVILVTLEKEQSLVTDTWPYPSQYQSAMGYGCPESQSVCDADYFGFYNQVHLGARLLRAGIARDCGDTQTLPSWSVASKWGVGKSPTVDGQPTFLSSCITGSLYNYTPHRPDSAYTAVNGTYFYGNYNFVNFFTNWFGSTWSNKLVRGNNSPRVYLLSESRKYYIGSGDILDSFRNLAPVRVIDQGFLDSVSAGADLKHFVVSPTSGAVYLIDAGNKMQFNTCTDVATFGGDCSSLVTLPDSVLNGFVNGPTVNQMVRNENGAIYKIEGAKKRTIVDMAIYQESGLNAVTPLGLTNALVATIPDGPPVLRENSLNINLDTGAVSLTVAGTLRYLPSMQLLRDWNFDLLPTYKYPNGLLGQSPTGTVITPFVSDSGHTYAIDGRSKRSLDAAISQWGSVPLTTLPAGLVAAVPVGATVGTQVVNRDTGAVYIIENSKKRLVPSLQDFNGLGLTNSGLASVSSAVLEKLADGTWKLGPRHLLKTGSSGAITMVDGSSAWKIPSPDMAATLGLNLSNTWTVDQATFDAYPASANIRQLWTDGSSQYVVDAGQRHLLAGSAAAAYAFAGSAFDTVGAATISGTTAGVDMPRLIKGPGPEIYYVESGQRRHVVSGATFNSLGGSGAMLSVTNAFIQMLPVGADLN